MWLVVMMVDGKWGRGGESEANMFLLNSCESEKVCRV